MPVFRRPFDFALRQRRPPPTPSSVGTVYNVTEANWFFSPGTWVKNGTTYAETNNPGAYCKFAFNGTGLAVGLDLSHWASEGTASRFPRLRWRVDGGAWQTHLTTNGQTSQVLASGLSDSAHTVELYFRAVSLNTSGLSRWEPPLFSLRLTSATVTAGVLTAPTLKTERWLIFGDSITEGTNALANTYDGTGQDASSTWGHQTAFALDAEVGVIGFVGQGWDIQGAGEGTDVPRLHQPGGEQAWDKHWQGQSRSFIGIEAVFVNTGANDGLQGTTDAAVESAAEDFLADFRAANASIPLYLIIPFGALKRSAIKQAYLDYQAGASDALAFLVDVSWQDATLLASLNGDSENSSSTYSNDDIHPNQAGHDRIAVLLGAALAAGDDPTVTTQAISSIAATTATGNGTVTQEGYAPVTERGVVLNTSGSPTTSDLKFVAGAAGPGAFTASLTGLDVDTHYYARAYAINRWGTSYGAEVEFDTATLAEIVLAPSTHIGASGEATTAQLTAPSGKTTSDFVAGRIQDDENPADSVNIGADQYTELEWAIQLTSEASGDYEFRVTVAGTPLDTYDETPVLGVLSGTLFEQAVSGTLTWAGVATGQARKPLVGALSPAGVLIRQGQKVVTGAQTPAGSLLRQGQKTLSGAQTPAGSLLRQGQKTLAGALSPAGALVRQGQKILSGAQTPAGSLLRQIQKLAAGSLTPSGALIAASVYLRDLGGTLASAGALLIQTNKRLAGSAGSAGALLARANKSLGGALAPAGALLRRVEKTLAGSLSPAGALDATRAAILSLAGTLDLAGSLARQSQKSLGGAVDAAGAVSKLAGRSLAGALSSSGALLKRTGKMLAGALSPTGDLTTTQSALISLGGTLSSAGALARQSMKSLGGTLSASGALSRQTQKLTAGALSSAGALLTQARKLTSGTLGTAGTLARQTQKLVGGTLGSAGALSRQAQHLASGTLGSAGALIRQAQKMLGGTLGLSGDTEILTDNSVDLGGTLGMSGSLVRQARKLLSGDQAAAGALTKRTSKTFGGTLSPAGALASLKAAATALGGTLSSTGSLVRRTNKQLAGAVSSAGTASKLISRASSGAVTLSGTLARQSTKFMGGTLASSGALVRQIGKGLGGVLASSGTLSRQISKRLAGVLDWIGTVVKLGGTPAVANPGYVRTEVLPFSVHTEVLLPSVLTQVIGAEARTEILAPW